MMEQPLKRSRCAEQGHVYFLPHDGYRHVNAFDTRKNVWHQIASLKGFGISLIRDLIVRCAVDLMEDGPRQSPACQRAEIPNIVASIYTHWLLHLCELWGNRSKFAHRLCPLKRREKRTSLKPRRRSSELAAQAAVRQRAKPIDLICKHVPSPNHGKQQPPPSALP